MSTPFIVGMVALILVLIGALYLRSHKSAPAPAPDSQAGTASDATPAQRAAPSPAPPAASHSRSKAQPKPSPTPAPPATARPSPETPARSSAAPAAPPAGSVSQPQANGEVIDRVMPEDRAHGDRTIHGKITVRVRVSVDRQGNVSEASLDQAGPSRYFAKIALQAAQKWRFRPPQVNGSPATSTWLLRFEFRRGNTTVNPVESTR